MRLAIVAVLSFTVGVLVTLELASRRQSAADDLALDVLEQAHAPETSIARVDSTHPASDPTLGSSSDSQESQNSQQAEPGRPIGLPDGFEIQDSVAALHRQLELEDTDHAWATYLEPQLSAYFSDERLSQQQFSAPSVECRRTLCEVQLVGYGPRAFTEWSEVTEDYASQPWMVGLVEPIVQVDRTASGATAFVIILQRQPGTVR